MGRAGVDAVRAADLHEGLGGLDDGLGGVHDVGEEDAVLARHLADDVAHLAGAGSLLALVHDGKTGVQGFGELARAGDGTDVRRDDHHVVQRGAELLGVVVRKQRIAEQVVRRNIKEALDLGGVEIHCQDTVGAGGDDHVRHQLRADGVAGLGLAILTRVAEVGDDRRDAPGRGAAAGVDHHQQLHQIVVDGLADRLDQEHVAAAHRLVEGAGDFAVGKALHLVVADADADGLADALCQRPVRVSCEYLDAAFMRNHGNSPFYVSG